MMLLFSIPVKKQSIWQCNWWLLT